MEREKIKGAIGKKENDREGREALIRRHVLELLGTPPLMKRLRVFHLFDQNYRVNILGGDDSAIIHTFFVRLDSNDFIRYSDPPIRNLYR